MWAAMVAIVIGIVWSCEKENNTEPDQYVNGYKMAKGVTVTNTTENDGSYQQPDVKAELRRLNEGQKDFGQESTLDSSCGVLYLTTRNQTFFNGMMQKEMGVGLYLTPCAGAPIMVNNVTLGAISIVIDYVAEDATMLPFDYTSVNPDLYNALSNGLGALITNNATSTGKFYFAYYCIWPITINTLSGDLFRLKFDNITPGTPLIFDQSTPENLCISSTGWDEMQLIISNATM